MTSSSTHWTGELLERHNQVYSAGPQGLVYTAQSPKGATQQIVSFAGWVTDRAPAGNNANAYVDNTGDDASDYQTQTPAAPDPNFQNFNYTFTDAYQTSGCTDRTTDQDATADAALLLGPTSPTTTTTASGSTRSRATSRTTTSAWAARGTTESTRRCSSTSTTRRKRNNASFLANNDGTNGRLRVLAGRPAVPLPGKRDGGRHDPPRVRPWGVESAGRRRFARQRCPDGGDGRRAGAATSSRSPSSTIP